MRTSTTRHAFSGAAALLATLVLTGCGIESQSAPDFIGPSEFGLSVTIAASPDRLPRDGSSQSIVTVTVRDDQGRPKAGQRLSIGVSPTTPVSQAEITTGSDGRASFAVVAPPQSTVASNNQLLVSITPVGTNGDDAMSRVATILLLGTPNATSPTAAFTFTPSAPERLAPVSFDASTSTDEGSACHDRCTYVWDFGGEATVTGRIVTYRFLQARSYAVRLTVTDSTGSAGSIAQNVPIINPAAPTVLMSFSPTAPNVGQTVNFTGASSTAAAGHSIVRYEWSFGDGSTSGASTSPTATHAYSLAGSYSVTLSVTDDVGQTRATSTTVAVAAGITASFSRSPTNPTIGQTIFLNASDSTTTAGATIVSYEWDFGNGLTSSGTTPTTTATYTTARTFTIRLTIVDSLGRTATTTQTITVS